MLLALGCSLTFLNLPMEYFTLAFDLPWMNLFNDVKQGIFYATLMVFWLVFTGNFTNGQRNISIAPVALTLEILSGKRSATAILPITFQQKASKKNKQKLFIHKCCPAFC